MTSPKFQILPEGSPQFVSFQVLIGFQGSSEGFLGFLGSLHVTSSSGSPHVLLGFSSGSSHVLLLSPHVLLGFSSGSPRILLRFSSVSQLSFS